MIFIFCVKDLDLCTLNHIVSWDDAPIIVKIDEIDNFCTWKVLILSKK